MNFSWKKWGIIIGASCLATASFALTPFIPILGPLLMASSILGGAFIATLLEIREEQMKESKKVEEISQEKDKAQTIEEAFCTLLSYSESLQIKEIEEKTEEIHATAKNISNASEHLEEEERFFIYHVLCKDVYQLFHSYSLFTLEEREEKKHEMMEILKVVQEKIEEIYTKIKRRKEKKFEKSKIFIHEKLKRY